MSMKRIRTVQDIINQLLGVTDKSALIEVLITNDGIDGQWITTSMFDFSIIDYTDCHEDDGEKENRVVLQCYR